MLIHCSRDGFRRAALFDALDGGEDGMTLTGEVLTKLAAAPDDLLPALMELLDGDGMRGMRHGFLGWLMRGREMPFFSFGGVWRGGTLAPLPAWVGPSFRRSGMRQRWAYSLPLSGFVARHPRGSACVPVSLLLYFLPGGVVAYLPMDADPHKPRGLSHPAGQQAPPGSFYRKSIHEEPTRRLA